ncbi:WxL domain-containing protein [Enterococcus sp. AZ072]|uniref:WxL domain-containing protein n=1 Tax=unclassified Enterococcus TaxID=2608891 RepID=UPI003D2C4172
MYSKTKTIVCLLITLCISVGGLVFTTVEAYADYTVNGNYYGTIYPRPIQFEFVDQNGNDFSENLTLSVPVTILKRNEKIDTVNDSIMATYPGPSTVSKIGGTNKFVYGNSLSNYFFRLYANVYIYTPPRIGFTDEEWETLLYGPTSIQITSPVSYVKEWRLEAPLGSGLPEKNTVQYNLNGTLGTHVLSTNINQSTSSPNIFVKNSDDTFAITSGVDILNTYASHRADPTTATLIKNICTTGGSSSVLRYYAYYQQIKEVFENTSGGQITPPTGYIQEKLTDITSDPFTYTMPNGSSLPQSYVNDGKLYTYKGWYKGAGNQPAINTSYPPAITINAEMDEEKDEIHIVYDEQNLYQVVEEYIDTNGSSIEAAWNMTTDVGSGDTFTAAPDSTKTDSNNVVWEYQGWKLSSELMDEVRTTPVSQVISSDTNLQYVYSKKQHTKTEKYVDEADGNTLISLNLNPATGTVDDNEVFTAAPDETIVDSTGKGWAYVGWENSTHDPGVVKTGPVSITNVKENIEVKYHYRQQDTTAAMNLTPGSQIVQTGDTVYWTSKITNTGTSQLNNIVLKSTNNWSSNLSGPTSITVTSPGGSVQSFTGNLVTGIPLSNIAVPAGGSNNYVEVTFSNTVTGGSANQVLPAEIDLSANIPSAIQADSFVRVDDINEPNLKPTGNSGFINLPDFRFGTVSISPFAEKHNLDASQYSGGYNPYIRFKSLENLASSSEVSVKISQFQNNTGTEVLPVSTTIMLKNGAQKKIQNYNKPNENLAMMDTIATRSIDTSNTDVFVSSANNPGIFQLDYNLMDVELQIPGNAGKKDVSYEAVMDWTLTIAP